MSDNNELINYNNNIENLIYNVRGQQVMLDCDLAMLYGVETKRLNESMKRNKNRFPLNFCFQLTDEEYVNLRSQNSTSNINTRGGRRYLPYVFTEQGIAMLSSVLKSDEAVEVSINIMNAFVKMRKFISTNSLLFDRINNIELKQLQIEKDTNKKFEEIFSYISSKEENEQKVFFEGQIFDAFSLIVSLIEKAETSIILIDNYVDISGTLNILSKKKENVKVEIYTSSRTKLTDQDITKFNSQYGELVLKFNDNFHDRFLILDNNVLYHIGASIKDAGKKCFGITKIEDEVILNNILSHINN